MYGGIDRSSIPTLKAGDDEFIRGVTGAIGSREAASRAFSERGFKLYLADDLTTAMRRFNQAWLLDPKNAEAHWGFAVVLHDRLDYCGAIPHMETASELGLAGAEFLADFGRITGLCGVKTQGEQAADAEPLLRRSEDLFETAVRADPMSGYVYARWASARYWRGDYEGAWAKVIRAQGLKADIPPRFLELLSAKLPRPR
jgi:tetratricopeptide (TPR) repeat protein